MRRERYIEDQPDPSLDYTQEQAIPSPPAAEADYDEAVVSGPSSKRMMLRLFILLIIISTILILIQTVFFRVKTVYVIGNSTVSAEYIISVSGLNEGMNIFSITEDEIEENLDDYHWVSLLHLYKRYPDEVYLFVTEREVVATIQWLGNEYTIDIDGVIMEKFTDMDYEGDVPTVLGFKVKYITIGDTISVSNQDQIVAYSAIISELIIQQYAEYIVSINLSDTDDLTLLTEDGITVELGDSTYMRAKIGAMRTDIAYLQQLGETSGVLDVTVPEDGKFKRE